MADPAQQTLDELWLCDVCKGTGTEQRDRPDLGIYIDYACRVCGGTGRLDYNPADCADNPFAGLETQT